MIDKTEIVHELRARVETFDLSTTYMTRKDITELIRHFVPGIEHLIEEAVAETRHQLSQGAVRV